MPDPVSRLHTIYVQESKQPALDDDHTNYDIRDGKHDLSNILEDLAMQSRLTLCIWFFESFIEL